MMLKEAQKGAASAGAQTEYIDLFDLSYNGCRSCLAYYFTGKVNVGIILTMNAPENYYRLAYQKKADEIAQSFRALNGTVEVYACCDTLQTADYSRFSMAGFSEEHKKAMREKRFPLDLAEAFRMGARLSGGK